MSDPIANQPNTFTGFVSRHRVALALTGTAALCLAGHTVVIRKHQTFLKDEGLFEKYYGIES